MHARFPQSCPKAPITAQALLVFGLYACLSGASPLFASPKAKSGVAAATSGVDSVMVRKFYMDGDFEPAIAILESSLKSQAVLAHDDSVFIFKHLGVMYAASYETRERGKMYMHQLLMTEPTAKIMDMYASDMIYMIFKNIQDEFETNRIKLQQAEDRAKGINRGDSNGSDPGSGGSGRSQWKKYAVWFGVASVAVGAGAYFWIVNSSASSANTHNL